MPDFSFPKSYRLRGQKDFQRVFERKCRAADEWIALYGWTNDLGHPRLGICASARLGPAVRRNLWKRRIREAFRLSKADLPAGLDLVVIPQRPDVPHLNAIQRSLWRLSRKLNVNIQKQKSRQEQKTRSAKGSTEKSA